MKQFTIKDRPGCIPVEEMKTLFERLISDTPKFKDTPLETAEKNGKFYYYENPDLDWMWCGFAIGLRCAERLRKAEKAVTAISIYNNGYHAGHHHTVEGYYVDILPCDMETIHADEVEDLLDRLH